MKLKQYSFNLILVCIMIMSNCPLSHGVTPTTPILPPTNQPSLSSSQNLLNQCSGYFTENKGQWHENISHLGFASFGKVAFLKDSIIFELLEDSKSTLIQATFVSGKPQSILGKQLLTHQSNYFLGSKWGVKCRNYHQIYLSNVWEGIDLVYSFTDKGLKQEFQLHSGADIADIQLQINEVELLPHLNPVYQPIRPFMLPDLQILAYTWDSSREQDVSHYYNGPTFALKSESCLTTEKLIVETILFSTYLGGSAKDFIHSIAVDEQGHTYVAGGVRSHNFPQSKTPAERTEQDAVPQVKGDSDAFVAKLNPSGTKLLYVTYLGGEAIDSAKSIAINSQACVFITGSTSSPDFPMNSNEGGASVPGYDQEFKGTSSAFVVKLNPTGSEIVYATFLGGTKADYGGSYRN